MKVNEAIHELKQELSIEEDWRSTLENVARKHGFRLEMLKNRFEKAFGSIECYAEFEQKRNNAVLSDAKELEKRQQDNFSFDRRYLYSVKCPFCLAEINEPCRTSSGEEIMSTYSFHSDRFRFKAAKLGGDLNVVSGNVTAAQVQVLWNKGASASEIAAQLSIGVSSVYRLRKRNLKL